MRAGTAGRVVRRCAPALAALALVAGLGAVPAQAASSWKDTRTEEFSSKELPDGCETYGGPYAGGTSYWMQDDVRLAGGLLRLRIQKREKDGHAWTSGGVGCWDWAQTYGRYEVRARVPRGKGIDSYVTLSPAKAGETAWTGIEMLAPGAETAYVTNGFRGGSESSQAAGRYSDGFHTYVIEWAPKLVRVSIDGRVVHESGKSYDGPRWFGLVVSNGDSLTGVPDAATQLPAEFQVDYVKVSKFSGVDPGPRPTQAPVSRDRPAATPTASALAKLPPATPSVATSPAVAATAAADPGGDLAGGIWPWLLGGSLIAGLAVLTLSSPWPRRRDR